ncbi:type II toxin-antitoxin system PemK/MazF family toxin [Desulforhabdus sp. TSK]|uniref:type II toxin-antitoxin system PemK/MazF family toxin n=1 Tax=Desulforhabdus sp. TSK TaxID=2925014 RepID=UPI001FC8CB83|nr:type II toxin-antitoxin system PemK/MazF family toxin [Desulforhabdus sp. TSK]GKT07854.1 mRNA interferase PemK [Desulforhabdus sp. TSK]
MKRGDIVLAVAAGDYGKPRPVVIVQSDLFNETHSSLVVCLMTSDLQDAPLFRITVQPLEQNGLQVPSQIMVDKIMALRRDKVRTQIGTLDGETMVRLNRSLMLFLGLA